MERNEERNVPGPIGETLNNISVSGTAAVLASGTHRMPVSCIQQKPSRTKGHTEAETEATASVKVNFKIANQLSETLP